MSALSLAFVFPSCNDIEYPGIVEQTQKEQKENGKKEKEPNTYTVDLSFTGDFSQIPVISITSAKGDWDLDIKVDGNITVYYSYANPTLNDYFGPQTQSYNVLGRKHAEKDARIELYDISLIGMDGYIVTSLVFDLNINFYRTRNELGGSFSQPVPCNVSYTVGGNSPSLLNGFVLNINGERIQ